jgi:DNA-binding protein HU-beta
MGKIGKSEIVAQVAEATGKTKKEVAEIVDAFLEKIIENVKAGKKVTFLGFGTFEEKVNKEKEGFNPKTKEKIRIPASKTIKFRPSKNLKEEI